MFALDNKSLHSIILVLKRKVGKVKSISARERRRYAQSRAPLAADRRTTSAERNSSVSIHDGRAHSLSIGGNRAAITRRHGNARSLP